MLKSLTRDARISCLFAWRAACGNYTGSLCLARCKSRGRVGILIPNCGNACQSAALANKMDGIWIKWAKNKKWVFPY